MKKDLEKIEAKHFEANIEKKVNLAEMPSIFEIMQVPNGSSGLANIGWIDQDFSHGYIEGFYLAGEKLVSECSGFYDYLVYPIVFNYRQYVELALKHIYMLTVLYFEENITFEKNHDIESYSKKLTKVLDSHNVGFLLPDEIRKSLIEISRLDEKNDKFRYVHDYKGSMSHGYKNNFIDLYRFRNGMEQIHEYFESILIMFDDNTGTLSDNKLCNFHFVNFVNLLSRLKKKSQLENKGELRQVRYIFDNMLKDKPLPLGISHIVDDREFYIDTNSTYDDLTNKIFTVNVKYQYNEKETEKKLSIDYAKLIFEYGNDNKVASLIIKPY